MWVIRRTKTAAPAPHRSDPRSAGRRPRSASPSSSSRRIGGAPACPTKSRPRRVRFPRRPLRRLQRAPRSGRLGPRAPPRSADLGVIRRTDAHQAHGRHHDHACERDALRARRDPERRCRDDVFGVSRIRAERSTHRSSGHGSAAMIAVAYSASRSSSWPRICGRNGKSLGATSKHANGRTATGLAS